MSESKPRIRSYLPLVALIALPSCATLPRALPFSNPRSKYVEQKVHVVSHGWHTGIILEAYRMNQHIEVLEKRFPHAEFYEIGWGDAGFYQAKKITAKITLNAVFLPSDTVVHVVGFRGDPAANFPTSELRDVTLTEEGLRNLCKFIDSSFAKDETSHPIPSSTGLYGDSQFYLGNGKYHLFNGCNKWTAKALSSGGANIEPMLKITSASVMDEFGTSKDTAQKRHANRKGAAMSRFISGGVSPPEALDCCGSYPQLSR